MHCLHMRLEPQKMWGTAMHISSYTFLLYVTVYLYVVQHNELKSGTCESHVCQALSSLRRAC